jgi:hypothetical protein
MTPGYAAGIFSGLVQLAAFAIYNAQIFKGRSTPNSTTWLLWVFLTVLSASSYAAMTADLAMYMLPATTAVATIGTFAYSLGVGRFQPIRRWDWLILAIGCVAGLVWWVYRSATDANLIVVFALMLSFWPTYRALWRTPSLETPPAWLVWTLAYALGVVAVLLRWQGHYADLAYPIMCLVMHPAVIVLCKRQRAGQPSIVRAG